AGRAWGGECGDEDEVGRAGAGTLLGPKGVPGVDIIFKGRRTDVQGRFRDYASAKLGRIAKLDHKAIRVDVEVHAERNPRQADRRGAGGAAIPVRGPAV